jgi:hypothetical protein
MPKGFSLHVGVDNAGPNFPGAEPLKGCKNDSRAMYDIASRQGFSERALLLDGEATYARVEKAIRAAAQGPDALGKDDIFLFTFAGHGDRASDIDRDEPDGFDESILLFDFMLFDDVLRRVLLPLFNPGVRVLMVSDSCHSGTVSSFLSLTADPAGFRKTERLSLGGLEVSMTTDITAPAVSAPPGVRTISDDVLYQHLWSHKDFYEKVLGEVPPLKDAPEIKANVLLLAACQDDELAGETKDAPVQGVFTKALIEVWDGGTFPGDHDRFKNDIGARIPPGRQQYPQLNPTGAPNAAFRAQRPFTVPFP